MELLTANTLHVNYFMAEKMPQAVEIPTKTTCTQ